MIAPEGAAAILLHDAARSEELLPALKLRAHDLLELDVIDDIVPSHRVARIATRTQPPARCSSASSTTCPGSRRSSQKSWCSAGPTATRPSGVSSVASSTGRVISSRESAAANSGLSGKAVMQPKRESCYVFGGRR